MNLAMSRKPVPSNQSQRVGPLIFANSFTPTTSDPNRTVADGVPGHRRLDRRMRPAVALEART